LDSSDSWLIFANSLRFVNTSAAILTLRSWDLTLQLEREEGEFLKGAQM